MNERRLVVTIVAGVLLGSPSGSTSAEEPAHDWQPATVFNHDSSMTLDARGALVDAHPKASPGRVLTGTDGGKDAEANNPNELPGAPPFPDTFGQAVKLTKDYLFVSAPMETNEHSPIVGGAVYVYQRQGDDWVFSQKLTGAETGEPWATDPPEHLPVPALSSIAADTDDLLFGVFRTRGFKGDGVLAYRLGDDTEDGVDNPVWRFDQKIVRPVPADFPPEFFGTRVAMDGDWLFVASNHEALKAQGASGERVQNAGAVYVFRRGDDSWDYVQRLTQPDGITEHSMLAGPGLAVQGNRAIISAVMPEGKSYAFELVQGDTSNARWKWTGQALSVTDNPEHPFPSGRRPPVLAAPAMDDGWLMLGLSSPSRPGGSVYVYQWDPGAGRWVFRQEIMPSSPQDGAGFGTANALDGRRALVAAHRFGLDLDGDGTIDIPDAGAAWVFERGKEGWQEVTRLQHPQPRSGDVFGSSGRGVSLTSSHAAVGTFVNSRGLNARPRLPGTHAGTAVLYAIP